MWLSARRSKNFPEGSDLGSSKWNEEEVAVGTVYDMDSEVRKLRKASPSVGVMEPITFLNWRVALVL